MGEEACHQNSGPEVAQRGSGRSPLCELQGELRIAAPRSEGQRKGAAENGVHVGHLMAPVRPAEALDRARATRPSASATSAPNSIRSRSWIVIPLIDSPPLDWIIVRGIAFRQRDRGRRRRRSRTPRPGRRSGPTSRLPWFEVGSDRRRAGACKRRDDVHALPCAGEEDRSHRPRLALPPTGLAMVGAAEERERRAQEDQPIRAGERCSTSRFDGVGFWTALRARTTARPACTMRWERRDRLPADMQCRRPRSSRRGGAAHPAPEIAFASEEATISLEVSRTASVLAATLPPRGFDNQANAVAEPLDELVRPVRRSVGGDDQLELCLRGGQARAGSRPALGHRLLVQAATITDARLPYRTRASAAAPSSLAPSLCTLPRCRRATDTSPSWSARARTS